jgi:hypothetical protein
MLLALEAGIHSSIERKNCFELEAAVTGDELHSLRKRWIQCQPYGSALREKYRRRTL